jgi:RNA polymerase sigma factor for flagellar operon FliA
MHSAWTYQAVPVVSEQEAVLSYLPWVRQIAGRLAMRMPAGLETQDLVGAGVLALIKALRELDASRRETVQAYVAIRVRGAMLDAIRKHDRVPRGVRDRYRQYVRTIRSLENRLGRAPDEQEICNELGLSERAYRLFLDQARPLSFLQIEEMSLSERALEEIAQEREAIDGLSPESSAEWREVHAILSRAIEVLPERERQVIELYYYEELNLKEIGTLLGVSESRICQLHTQALLRLKARLQKEDLET